MIPSGTIDHNIMLVVSRIKEQDILTVCQRGSSQYPSLAYFPIDRSLIDEDIIKQLEFYITTSIDEPGSFDFFYERLPNSLSSPTKEKISNNLDSLRKLLQCKPQKCNNCTLTSTKAAAAAIIAIQTYNQCLGSCSFEQMQHLAKVRYIKEIGLCIRRYLKEKAETDVIDLPKDTRALFERKLLKRQEKILKLKQEHS